MYWIIEISDPEASKKVPLVGGLSLYGKFEQDKETV